MPHNTSLRIQRQRQHAVANLRTRFRNTQKRLQTNTETFSPDNANHIQQNQQPHTKCNTSQPRLSSTATKQTAETLQYLSNHAPSATFLGALLSAGSVSVTDDPECEDARALDAAVDKIKELLSA